MKGFIYIIRSHQTDDVYYGSTTQMLCKRMSGHRKNYKLWLDGSYGNNTSFEIIKYNDAYIELVEEVEFQNKQELYAREGHYIRENKCVNKLVAGRTHEERYETNRDKIKEQRQQYRIDNKEQINKLEKQKYIDTREQSIARVKKYQLKNREVILEKRRQKYAKSKLLKNVKEIVPDVIIS